MERSVGNPGMAPFALPLLRFPGISKSSGPSSPRFTGFSRRPSFPCWSQGPVTGRSSTPSTARVVCVRFHPSSSRLLFRVPSLILPPPVSGELCLIRVFEPSSRHRRTRPPSARRPFLASFRPRVFSTSRRFAPRSALPACFVRLPRPGFSRWLDWETFSLSRWTFVPASNPRAEADGTGKRMGRFAGRGPQGRCCQSL